MEMGDGFTLVKYKHPRQYKYQTTQKIRKNCHQVPDGKVPGDCAAGQTLGTVLKYIENCKIELQTSSFYKELMKLIADNLDEDIITETQDHHANTATSFEDFVCYGIGRLSESPIARYQFALYLLLWQQFKPSGQCLIYDPVFTSFDEQIINHFGLVLLTKNEEAKRQVASRTLFFAPHCGKPLYNNILWANWGPGLKNVVILGNSFRGYHEKMPLHLLNQEAAYIFCVLPIMEEVGFPLTFHHDDVFNDLSIHFFKAKKLQKQDLSFWDNCKEPVYDDDNVEIILKSPSLR